MIYLETDRLILRSYKGSDRASFRELNSDRHVMRFFGETFTQAKSDEAFGRLHAHIQQFGYGFFATELKATGAFIGFLGIKPLPRNIPIGPGLEIGWRFQSAYWGQGLAPEGARACLKMAFETVKVPDVIAITSVTNRPSQRVMEKIGMVRDPSGDFDHPEVFEGPHRAHVTYRLTHQDWLRVVCE